MKTIHAVALAFVAFAAGAFLTGAAAQGGMGAMAEWSPAEMWEFCRGMMGG